MVRSLEIPDCIRNIEPEYQTIPLSSFLEDKGFQDNLQSVFREILSDRPGNEILIPKILIFYFSGISYLEYEQTRQALEIPLRDFRGTLEIYSIYANFSTHSVHASPWQVFKQVVESCYSRKPVVVGSCENKEYILVGNLRKDSDRNDTWEKLRKEKAWVNGQEFKGDLTVPQMEYLNRLQRDGLALKRRHGSYSYFRSIV